MSVTTYKDAAKAAKDLLSKPYPENHKVELKASNAGVTFTAEAALGPVPAAKKGKKPTPALLVKGEGAVTGGFKVDKLSIDTNRDLTGEFSLADAFKGGKLTFKATDGTRAAAIDGVDPISAVFGVEHSSDSATVGINVDVLKYSLEASGVAAYEGALFGVSATVSRAKDTGKFEASDYSALLGYGARDFKFTLQGEKKFESFVASWHQKVNPSLSVAAQAKFPRALAEAAAKFELSAGVQYKTASDATLAGKVSHDGKVAFSYAQALSPLAKITIGTEIDAPKIASDNAHKLAIAVAFSA